MKISVSMLKKFLPILAVAFVLPFFAQSAKATSVDFLCGPLICNGNVTATFSGGTLVSASDLGGITVINDSGPADDGGLLFTLLFDTSLPAPNIAVAEQGGDGSILAGTIVGFSGAQFGSSETVDLQVLWTGMPADFAAFLGSSTGTGFVDNIILTLDGSAQSIDVNIQPTPEPGSLLLLGSGILSFGGLLRRKIFKA